MPGAAQDQGYTALIAELVTLRDERLERQPSDRTLATAAEASPTTIGKWLYQGQFPQDIGSLLRLVRAVGTKAKEAGLLQQPDVARLLDEQRWQRAYEGEASRRAVGTRTSVLAAQSREVLERMRPGRPLTDVTDPFHLEVHHSIGTEVAGLPKLPAYVEREHDRVLAGVVAQAAAGTSRIAVLVGGSSTGKTRTCWEALRLLRAQDEPWRLWHPDPTQPDTVLTELANLAPHTVVWLNEAQFYLSPTPTGEEVARGLRTLLHDPQRTPVMVLATLWPGHWQTLTTRADPDLHGQARQLLDGHKIKVPESFTSADLASLTDTAGRDPRLSEAAAHARDGQITQYLAGGLILLDRYEDAPPAARALIHAAMDARRLGAGPHLPLAWLAQAVPGYLTDSEREESEDHELGQTLNYVTTRWNGIPGILTSVKTGADPNQRNRSTVRSDTGPARRQTGQRGPLYRLADYLDQHGRRRRADTIPPVGFWAAAADHAHPDDLDSLADAARRRGLYLDSAQLHKHATTHGSAVAAVTLVHRLGQLHPADFRPALWAAAHAALDDPDAVTRLLYALRKVGTQDQVNTLLTRNPAADAALDNPYAVTELLGALREAGAQDQVNTLAARAAADAPLDDPEAVRSLLDVLREAGAQDQVNTLAARAAADAPLDDPYAVRSLLYALRKVGTQEQVNTLLTRNPAADAALDNPYAVPRLLDALREVGAQEQVNTLAARAAADAPLDDPYAVRSLLYALREVGSQEQVNTLAARAAADAPLDDPGVVTRLLYALREAGAQEQVEVLGARAAADAPLDNPHAVTRLLNALLKVRAQEQVIALTARAAVGTALDNPDAVARLLNALRKVGTQEQVNTLLTRNPAADAALDNPHAVTELLDALREVGAQEQVNTLAARAAADAALDNPHAVTELLYALREVGSQEQVNTLAARAAADAALDNPHAVTRLLDALREVGS
ncbi:hypothetical protein, partial [Streptomyces collinus]|uniref:hypothetical protein n=1 Tax=Streptomyces collinus TaxID=42684 RepID=UPI0033F69E07